MESSGICNKHLKKIAEVEPMQRPSSSAVPYPPVANALASPDTLARVLLSETVAAQSRLAAALSHDLNSPIGALNSALDTMSLLLRRHEELPQQNQQNRELSERLLLLKQVADQACGRLTEVVNRMQRFTGLDRAQVQQANVNDLLKDATDFLRPELNSKAEVILDLNELRPLACKPKQLCAVFLELLRNAISHLPEKGKIRINSRESKNEITVQISDNGVGIDPELMLNLFEPAFAVRGGRVVTSNWTWCTSRSVVLDHGGQIEIDSAEGKGTSVTIRLPHTTATETKERHAMTNQSVAPKQNTKPVPSQTATYFGLTVEVIAQLPNCSLIRYGNREFVVESVDLQKNLALGQAA
jgi:signal transduction histidine kinase